MSSSGDDDASSQDDGFTHFGRDGKAYCSAHLLELCHLCCVDHRPTNEICLSTTDVDVQEVYRKHDKAYNAEMAAMSLKHRQDGNRDDLILGSEQAQKVYDAVAGPPPSGKRVCELCGIGGELLRCGECKSVWYCSAEHQKEHWKSHKSLCKSVSSQQKLPSSSVLKEEEDPVDMLKVLKTPILRSSHITTWERLKAQGDSMIRNREVLELRILSDPDFTSNYRFEGKDRNGDVNSVFFAMESAPEGLELGRVFRWLAPRLSRGLSGKLEVWVTEEDLPHVAIVDS